MNTNLYPDTRSVKAALESIGKHAEIKWIELDSSPTGEAFWDSLVRELLAANKIISI